MEDVRIAEVLRFWFEELRPEQYWTRDDALDRRIIADFGALHAEAVSGALAGWMATPEGALALVIVLDQFPRNMFRGDPRSWASDSLALAHAKAAIDRGHDRALPAERRHFLYLPFEHSEDLAMQERSLELFGAMPDLSPEAKFAVERHHEIIARFGRFPHRNAVLGRVSTPEEIAFLNEPHSSF
ncbi:MAG: DUF924 family protein [Pseudomonadota bacterium]|nr:DUF924 family protein [Pseudomonadota bacterium]